MIFEKELDIQKLIWMIKLVFENFFKFLCCEEKTWNDWNNYFILQIDIQLQWNVEYLKFLKSKKHVQKIIFLIFYTCCDMATLVE